MLGDRSQNGRLRPWDFLGAPSDNHFQTLSRSYVPVGLIEMLEFDPKTSLDVGCFVGATSEYLKMRHPECLTVAIEPSERAAAIAKTRVDRIHIGKLEDVDMASEGYHRGFFDLIVMADVLEHMYDPWGSLRSLLPLLSERGCVLASIPNTRNLHVLNQLVQGDWRYEPTGLLDITHIRFFTPSSVKELFESSGYIIEKLNFNSDPRFKHVNVKNNGNITLKMGRLTIESVTEDEAIEFTALQIFVLARRSNTADCAAEFFGRKA